MSRLMSTEEAAVTLGCHPETIRRAIRNRELLAYRSPVGLGRKWVIDSTDLHAFVEKRKAR